LILINGHFEPVEFTLPECAGAYQWTLLIDTFCPDDPAGKNFDIGAPYSVTERSLVLFQLKAEQA
jgi:glycogen operon protein